MLQYFDFSTLSKLDSFVDNCWIDVNSPTNEDFQYLNDKLSIPIDTIHDVLDIDERSRIEIEENILMIILRIPIVNHNHEIPFFTVPLGIFIGSKFIVTLCLTKNEIINDIINQQKFVNKNSSIVSFVSQIFQKSTNLYLKYLKQINFQTNKSQKELEKSSKNSELLELLKLEKSLVFFVTSLKTNELLIHKMKSIKLYDFQNIDEDEYEDLLIDTKQAIEMAKIYSDILSGMMDAFASIISNNLNQIMKHLTLITIVLMVPTLIASLFGMNIQSGLEHNQFAFYIIFGISLTISVFVLFTFKKRNLF